MKLSNNVVHIATFLILLSLISCGDSKDKSKADDSNTVLQTQKIISDSSKAVNNLDSLKRELKKLEDSKRFVDEKLSLSFFDAKKIAENKFLKEGKRTILVGLNPRDWLETNNGVLIESWELVFKDNFNNEMINAIVRLEINEDNKIERNLEYSVLNLASCDSLNKIKNETIDGTNKFLCTYANANPINDIYLDMNQILKIADASAKKKGLKIPSTMVLFQNSKDTKYGVSTWLVKFTAPQKKDDYIMFEFNVVIRADNGEILETDSSP